MQTLCLFGSMRFAHLAYTAKQFSCFMTSWLCDPLIMLRSVSLAGPTRKFPLCPAEKSEPFVCVTLANPFLRNEFS